MRDKKQPEMSKPLGRLARRFAAWRKSRVVGQRIPEALWESAARVAAEHGVNSTARALNLDYYSLKKRVEEATVQAAPRFVELPSSSLSRTSECVIEWEDSNGARMRVQLNGQHAPDLLELSRSFWNAD